MLAPPDFEYVDEDQLHPELRCSICMRPLVDPVEDVCSPSPHTFCSPCISGWVAGKSGNGEARQTCPESRLPLQLAALRPAGLARRMTNELKVFCSKREEGCEWTGRRDNLSDHIANSCEHSLIPCAGADVGMGPAVPGCPMLLRRATIDEHAEACPFVLMKPLFSAVSKEMNSLNSKCRRLQNRVIALEEIVTEHSLARKKRGAGGGVNEVMELDANGAPKQRPSIHVSARLLGDPDSCTLSFALARSTRFGKLFSAFSQKVHEFTSIPLPHADPKAYEFWRGIHLVDPDETSEDLDLEQNEELLVRIIK